MYYQLQNLYSEVEKVEKEVVNDVEKEVVVEMREEADQSNLVG